MKNREEEDYPSELASPTVAEEMAYNSADSRNADWGAQPDETREQAKARVLTSIYSGVTFTAPSDRFMAEQPPLVINRMFTYYGDPRDPASELAEQQNGRSPQEGDQLCDGHRVHYTWKDGKWE